jgi:hypothetical protein
MTLVYQLLNGDSLYDKILLSNFINRKMRQIESRAAAPLSLFNLCILRRSALWVVVVGCSASM